MASSIRIILFLSLLLIASDAYTGKKFNSQTGRNDFCVTFATQNGSVSNAKCKDIKVSNTMLSDETTHFLLTSGLANGGSVSMATSDTAVSTSYTFIKKAIATDPAFQAGTLANGSKGQIITIQITEVEGDGDTFTLTPTTKTGFTSLIFEGVGDLMTLLYVDDTVGWIPLTHTSVQIQ